MEHLGVLRMGIGSIDIPRYYLENPHFDLWNAYALRAYRALILAECTPFSLDDLEGELVSFFSNRSRPESLPALQHNAATPRDFRWVIPEPIVIVVNINGHPARALLDSGSLSDFMSVHLAVQGSRAKITVGCKAH